MLLTWVRARLSLSLLADSTVSGITITSIQSRVNAGDSGRQYGRFFFMISGTL